MIPLQKLTAKELVAQSELASAALEKIRARLLSPQMQKRAPIFTAQQVADLCGIDRDTLTRWAEKRPHLPKGTPRAGRRQFELAEAMIWIREAAGAKGKLRPANQKAITICVAFFKGGVGKTTTAYSLAQGLSLLGHRVLVIDTDAQGSLTLLAGKAPNVDVFDENTLIPIFDAKNNPAESVEYAIQPTYWEGVDLIPACSGLFNAEMMIPSPESMRRHEYRFWEILNKALEPVRDRYDVILIDTPPSLGYMTLNALWASNGVIVPMPPSNLDYASSIQFWRLLAEFAVGVEEAKQDKKAFDFVRVLLSKVDSQDTATHAVRSWIQKTYSDLVMPVEIPKSTVQSNASAAGYRTLYDFSRYEGSKETYLRARRPYDEAVEIVDGLIRTIWVTSNKAVVDAQLIAEVA